MTATRDPDRLLRAWLDLMPNEAPDRAIAAVLQAAETTRQVRALPRIGRWRFPMNRLTIVAAVAALIVALVGGAIVFVGSNNSSLPTATPTPTATALSTPTVTEEPVIPAADALWGLWIAEAETIPGLPNQGSKLGMGFNWDGGRDFSVGTSFGGTDYLTSDTLASTAGQFRLRARDDTHGCASGDVGTYGWQRSANGLFLSVTLVSDECALRGITLARTWVRTLGVANDGRTGMATTGDPYPFIQVTVSGGRWAMDALPPVDIHTADGSPGRDLLIYVNPQGLGEPCSTPGSKPFALQPTADALKTYLKGLPGMGAVSSKAVTVDGKPATHITSTVGECQGAELALFTQPAFPGSNGGVGEVRAPKGMAVSLWTIVHNGDLVVIWYAGDNIPAAEEQAIIDSLRIMDGLPTP